MSQHPTLPWLSLTEAAPTPPTFSTEIATNTLLLAAHALALALFVLEHQLHDRSGANAVRHLRAAQREIEAAQAEHALAGRT
jgi:hypothetical protein